MILVGKHWGKMGQLMAKDSEEEILSFDWDPGETEPADSFQNLVSSDDLHCPSAGAWLASVVVAAVQYWEEQKDFPCHPRPQGSCQAVPSSNWVVVNVMNTFFV